MKNYRFSDIKSKIEKAGLLYPLDVLLVGGTGTGKSSTLNALFGSTVAKVGDGCDPETKVITSYALHDFLRFHDSAGLGDGKITDDEYSKNINSELLRTCTVSEQQYRFIDIVLVLLDGGSRDLGTTFRLLESVVLKSIEPNRVIVAINQADMAMKGRNWNSWTNRPEQDLINFLEEKSCSIKNRIKESTSLIINKPIYYSAQKNYNINALLDYIIYHLPTSRRVI